ncbi:MAG: hypothetical protein WKF40_08845 [Thermoleophilaceae bacterium]
MAVEHDLDVVRDLERPEQSGVGLHAPGGLCDDGGGAERPVVANEEVEGDRLGLIGDRQSPCTLNTSPLPSIPVELNVMSRRLRTSSSIVWWMLARSRRRGPAFRPFAFWTRRDVASAVSSMLVCADTHRAYKAPRSQTGDTGIVPASVTATRHSFAYKGYDLVYDEYAPQGVRAAPASER